MSKKDEALKNLIEAQEVILGLRESSINIPQALNFAYEALAEQESQKHESVVIDSIAAGIFSDGKRKEIPFGTKLYTHPLKRLTDEEIEECFKSTYKEINSKFKFANAIQDKLGVK